MENREDKKPILEITSVGGYPHQYYYFNVPESDNERDYFARLVFMWLLERYTKKK